MLKKVIIAMALLMLPSCGIFGSYYEAEPVGVGKGVDELNTNSDIVRLYSFNLNV